MAQAVMSNLKHWLVRVGPVVVLFWSTAAIAPRLPLPAAAAPDPAAASTASYPILQRGSQGTAVRQLQGLLGQAGYTVTADGDFGAATETAVKQFQIDHQLPADGIVGPQSWAQLWRLHQPLAQQIDLTAATAVLPHFNELTPLKPERPPSPIWLLVMPLIPIVGGGLTYLQHRYCSNRG